MMGIQTLIGTLSPISIMLMLFILGELSRRLGEVVKAGKHHRWFYVSGFLAFISVLVRLLFIGASKENFIVKENMTIALFYIGPLALALFIGVVVAWRYWGWLIYASEYGVGSRF